MPLPSSLDIDVVDVKGWTVSADVAEGALVRVEIVGELMVDMHISPLALAKLEAFVLKAIAERAKSRPRQ